MLYFIIFIILLSLWAFQRLEIVFKQLHWKFLRRLLQIYSFIYLCIIYAYQFPLIHKRIPARLLFSRYILELIFQIE